jgi:hypothetical protein
VERRRGNLKFHCPAHETASSVPRMRPLAAWNLVRQPDAVRDPITARGRRSCRQNHGNAAPIETRWTSNG